MRLVVDGLIFQKDPYGGVARVFREILPLMCSQAPDLQVTLFLDGPVQSELPAHPQLTVKRAPPIHRTIRVRGLAGRAIHPFRVVAGQAWNQLRGRWLGSGEGAIWHSTFYTLPPPDWKGLQVVTVHDMVHEHLPQFFAEPVDDLGRDRKRQCVQAAQAIICVSENTRRSVLAEYSVGRKPVRVVYNAYSPVFRQLKGPVVLDDSLSLKPYLLYVGSRADYKNFNSLLDVYRLWPGRNWINLVVVGAPWTEGERHRIADLGLDGNVRLRTVVNDEMLCRLYNAASAFVYPSMNEGFGIPLLEAMACGCPVVASNIPVFREVAGDAALFFRLDRPRELMSALDRAIELGPQLPQVAVGLERVRLFSWEKSAAQTLDVYRSLLPE